MTGLDTSVVVRLLVGEPVSQAIAARDYLDELFEKGEQVFISDLVVSETYFALQFHYKVPKQEILDALKAVFDSGDIRALEAAANVLETPNLSSAKPGFVDRLIHQRYIQSQGSMATFERKAKKLPRTIVIGSES